MGYFLHIAGGTPLPILQSLLPFLDGNDIFDHDIDLDKGGQCAKLKQTKANKIYPPLFSNIETMSTADKNCKKHVFDQSVAENMSREGR